MIFSTFWSRKWPWLHFILLGLMAKLYEDYKYQQPCFTVSSNGHSISMRYTGTKCPWPHSGRSPRDISCLLQVAISDPRLFLLSPVWIFTLNDRILCVSGGNHVVLSITCQTINLSGITDSCITHNKNVRNLESAVATWFSYDSMKNLCWSLAPVDIKCQRETIWKIVFLLPWGTTNYTEKRLFILIDINA